MGLVARESAMSKQTFRERLQTGAPILADGAMGTMLHQESQRAR